MKNDAIRKKRPKKKHFQIEMENEKDLPTRQPVFDLGSRVRSGSGSCGGVVVRRWIS